MTDLLKEVEFIFVPFVNPDGYEVSELRKLLNHTCTEDLLLLATAKSEKHKA